MQVRMYYFGRYLVPIIPTVVTAITLYDPADGATACHTSV